MRTSHLIITCAAALGASGLGIDYREGGERHDVGARTSAADSASGVLADTQRVINYKAVVDAAQSQYNYETTPRPPVDVTASSQFDGTGYSEVNSTKITIATAARKAGASPTYVIKARIESDVDLPKFGVRKGTTYVWQQRPSADPTTWSVYLVHAKFPWKHRKLKEGPKFVGGSHPEIHLIRATQKRMKGGRFISTFAFGVCTDDCPSGHCGYQ